MNIYTSGLGNVGSYQVSGRPFLKTNTSLAADDTEYIKFDNVTKKIRVKNHSRSGVLKIGFADNARRCFDLPNAGSTDHLASANFGSKLTTFTVAFWIKSLTGSPETVSRIVGFENSSITGAHTRVEGRATGALRFFMDGTGAKFTQTADGVTLANTWHHIVVVINGTDNRLYVDSNLVTTNTNIHNPNVDETGYDSITFGDDQSANFDDRIDEAYFFNVALTTPEVVELYNEGAYYDPRNHSQAANLTSWWAFEDNAYRTYFSTNDTTTTILDRIGNINLTSVGTGTGFFAPGRQLDTAIHSHSITVPAGGEIELNVKTKSMFLFATGSLQSNAPQNFDVYASLTNIPSERMHDLTGSGIDA